MNKLGLSRDGIVVPQTWKIPIAHVSTKPAQDLYHIERLLAGDPVKIAVIRSTGGIGDVLMTFPTVKTLKKRYNCELSYVTDPTYLTGALKKCAEHNPFIDRIVDFKQYNNDDFDININMTCPCIAHETVGAQPIHRIDLFARHCGMVLEDRTIDYVLTEEELIWGMNYFNNNNLHPDKCIMVQVYASNARRSYHPSNLRDALIRVKQVIPDIQFLIIQHDSDYDKNTSWDIQGFHQLKNFDIVSLAAIMKQVRLVLCPDSAILHLAGALNKDIISFFGPTDPRARLYPNMQYLWPAQGNMACLPCWWTCPNGMKTWNYLKPEMISEMVLTQLSQKIPIPVVNIESI